MPLDLGGATYLVRKQRDIPAAEILDIGGADLTVIGDGGANIRIAPDCGNYRAMFAPRSYQAVRNWRFLHVGFDKNSQNNVIPNDEIRSNTPGRYSVVLRGHIAGQVLFDGCVFHNSDAVVDIYLPEPFNDPGGARIMPPEARPTNNLVKILNCH